MKRLILKNLNKHDLRSRDTLRPSSRYTSQDQLQMKGRELWKKVKSFKGYLHCKVILCYKIPLDVQLMNFFIWRKNHLLFLRRWGFCIFVKSADFKICDVIIGIVG